MCEIARHAGVGQATLYRNFPDCRNLVAALILEQMEQTEEAGRRHAGDPDAFFVLIRNVVETMAAFHALAEWPARTPVWAPRSTTVGAGWPSSCRSPCGLPRPPARCGAI